MRQRISTLDEFINESKYSTKVNINEPRFMVYFFYQHLNQYTLTSLIQNEISDVDEFENSIKRSYKQAKVVGVLPFEKYYKFDTQIYNKADELRNKGKSLSDAVSELTDFMKKLK